MNTFETVYLTRRNLLTLLSKLDRKASGEDTYCAIIKGDHVHSRYPQTMGTCIVIALEDSEYYTDRDPGPMHELDTPK